MDNIHVEITVGRFLEHSRIVCFGNDDGLPSRKAKLFISSAGWMPRNLDRRAETLVPIENPAVHQWILDEIMIANLKDRSRTWHLEPDGNCRREPRGVKAFSARPRFMTNLSLPGRGAALIREQIRIAAWSSEKPDGHGPE